MASRGGSGLGQRLGFFQRRVGGGCRHVAAGRGGVGGRVGEGAGWALAQETDWSQLEAKPLAGFAEVHDTQVQQRKLLQAGGGHLQHRPAGAFPRLQGGDGQGTRWGGHRANPSLSSRGLLCSRVHHVHPIPMD